MVDTAVPVSMGSPDYGTCRTESALVTLVSFPRGAVLDAHLHDRPTLAVVLEGGFDLVLPGRPNDRSTFACPSGTVLTQPAGERHMNRFGDAGASGVVLQPDIMTHGLPQRCRQMLESVNHFRDARIVMAARRLASEIGAPDEVTPLVVEGLVLEMFATAARHSHVERGRAPRWLGAATDYIHEHFRESIRIADVAAVAGVHAAHLAAVFRSAHGSSIGAYVRRLRVDWAAERLMATDLPIANIAAQAGFADQAHLTRWFRHITGWSPAVYRQTRRQA